MHEVMLMMLMEIHVLYIRKVTASKKDYFKAESNRSAFTKQSFYYLKKLIMSQMPRHISWAPIYFLYQPSHKAN